MNRILPMMVVAGLCGLAMADGAVAEAEAHQAGETAAQATTNAWHEALRAKVRARTQADLETYGRDGCRDVERAYRAYSKSKEAENEHLKTLLEKFPKANRTGCAVMYAGQRSKGADAEKWFRLAMEKHGDCMYGDGAQVGAYARFYLAKMLDREGKKEEAKALRAEILSLYPDARTHRGRKMADFLKQDR